MRRPTTGQMIWWGIGLILGLAVFFSLRGLVVCWRLTSLPGVPLPGCSNAVASPVNAAGTPIAQTAEPTLSAPGVDLPAPWDGASRVNFLFLGLDRRDVEDVDPTIITGPPRTDTMILLTIDPLSKTAGAISIPRDMWVNIPGFGYGKINTAYTDGEAYKLPGGGPAMAMKAVSSFLGVPIQYYGWIEFSAFINAVDRIGGVDVCVPAAMDVGLYDQEGKAHLEPGCQTLSGIVALGYARDRYSKNGDVDRSERQMQVLLGLLDKIASPQNWAMLVREAPGLYQDLSSGIHTNLSLTDGLRLAALAREIPKNKIQFKVIDYTMMIDAKSPTGLDILRPFSDKIRVLRDSIFGGGSMIPMASGDPTQLMQVDGARVVVVNGTGTAGLAARTQEFLKSQGMNVIGAGNTTDYPDRYGPPFSGRTIIIVHNAKLYTMKYLMTLMKFDSSSQIKMDFDPTAPADLLVGLGYDWANDNPLP